MVDVCGIFSGGGMKGVAFVGALVEAQKHVRFVKVGGTSAGAMVASLLSCGYDGSMLKTILFDAPYSEFFKHRHPFSRFCSPRLGRFHPNGLREWLRQKFKDRLNIAKPITFQMFHDKSCLPLRLVATNLSTQDIKVYSLETTPQFEVAQAVVTSCSYPFAFPPSIEATDELVDGGLLSNFPMWLFDDPNGSPQPTTLGFALVPGDSVHYDPSKSVLGFTKLLLDALMLSQDKVQERFLQVSRPSNIIRICSGDVGTFELNLTRARLEWLFKQGQTAAEDYFRSQPPQPKRVATQGFELEKVMELVNGDRLQDAVKHVARAHLWHGGVAIDSGVSKDRRFVRYYVDFMEAATSAVEREAMAKILVRHVNNNTARLGGEYCIAGLKLGNPLLAARTAEMLQRPFVLMKSNLSWKPGDPFDGNIPGNSRLLIVDDVASDKTPLLHAIRQLRRLGHHPVHAVVLVNRKEGEAEAALQDTGCPLLSVCHMNDDDFEHLVANPV